MSRKTKLLEQVAEAAGLFLNTDPKRPVAFGQKGGYDLCLTYEEGGRNAYFVVYCGLSDGGAPLTKEALRELRKSSPLLESVMGEDAYRVSITLKTAFTAKGQTAKAAEALDALVTYLWEQGYQNCCQRCGKRVQAGGFYSLSGAPTLLCEDCVREVSLEMEEKQQQQAQKPENVLGGLVGALLGGLIGGGCIVLLEQLGVISVISGLVMGFCTLHGYRLLGGKRGAVGTVLCVVVMVVMTALGDAVDWALLISSEFEVDFLTALGSLGYLLEQGAIEVGDYMANLLELYLFNIVGAGLTVWEIHKTEREDILFQKIERKAEC
jgi:hypothetical protein